jgi:acetyl esterase
MQRGLVRQEAAGPLPVRIYRPLSSATPLPTIVWYHGGGWTTGSLETGDIVARALSGGTPAVVVSVAYRLGPEHPWPAATEDVTAALQWAAAHIGELGGDPKRIAAGGDSAGGNLAAVAAQLARDSGPHLAAQILIYPVLDLDMDRSDRYPSRRDNADGYHVTRDELRWCVRNYLPAGTDLADPRISPARHPGLTGLPATVLAVAEYDPLRDQGTAYAGALRAASVPVTLHLGLGLIHGCFDMLGVTAAARDELGRVLRSLREALAVTPSMLSAARPEPSRLFLTLDLDGLRLSGPGLNVLTARPEFDMTRSSPRGLRRPH